MRDYDVAINPETAKDINKIVKAYKRVEQQITVFIAEGLKQIEDQEIQEWILFQQQRITQINDELFTIVNQPEIVEASEKAKEIIVKGYLRGVDEALPMPKKWGTTRSGIIPTGVRGIEAETAALLSKARSNFTRQGNFLHRKAVSDIAGLVSVNSVGTRDAINFVSNKVKNGGVPVFVDKSGRAWKSENYVDMAMKTAVNRAHLRGKLDRYVEISVQLVKVPQGRTKRGSSKCDKCGPWEGKILSLTGEIVEPAVATLEQAQQAGLFHPRCGHTVRPFYNS